MAKAIRTAQNATTPAKKIQNAAKSETKYVKPTAQTQAAAAHQVAYTTPVKTQANTGSVAKSTQTTPAPAPTPTYTAPAPTSGMIGTAINPGGMITSTLERAMQNEAQSTLPEHDYNMQNYGISVTPRYDMNARPNETPSQTTDRYLGILGSVTGARGTASRPYSSPNFSYQSGNGVNLDLDGDSTNNLITDYIRDSLVGEVGDDKPFALYPNEHQGMGGIAVNGPQIPLANQRENNRQTISDYIGESLGRIGEAQTGIPANSTPNLYEAYMTGQDWIPSGTVRGGDTVNNTDIDNSVSVGGSKGGSAVGGTGAYENAYDLGSLYDLLNARLNEYNNQYNSLMDNLLGAYNANTANLDDYYNAVLNALGLNYADTENILTGQLANSQQALEDERRRAMQEAYISRMMAEKQLADQLDAYGLTGGASESVMANLRNNYMNNRAGVEERTQNSLKDLFQTFLGNMSNARQNYNQSLMSAAQNRLNARQQLANNYASSQADAANYLANARSGAYDDLFNTLARLYT